MSKYICFLHATPFHYLVSNNRTLFDVGAQTGKVLGYEVRSKVCRICQSAERNKKEAKDHDCRQNWQGVYCLKTISKYVK